MRFLIVGAGNILLFVLLFDAFVFGRRELSNNRMKADEPQRHSRCYDD